MWNRKKKNNIDACNHAKFMSFHLYRHIVRRRQRTAGFRRLWRLQSAPQHWRCGRQHWQFMLSYDESRINMSHSDGRLRTGIWRGRNERLWTLRRLMSCGGWPLQGGGNLLPAQNMSSYVLSTCDCSRVQRPLTTIRCIIIQSTATKRLIRNSAIIYLVEIFYCIYIYRTDRIHIYDHLQITLVSFAVKYVWNRMLCDHKWLIFV